MAAVPPGQPIAPGIVAPNAGFPQWGVLMNANNTSGTVTEATSAAQKTTMIGQGYDAWFSSAAAAQAFVSSETSALNGSIPSIPGLPSWSLLFGNTKGLLTRFLKVLIGGVLLIAGIMRLSGKDKDIIQTATKAVTAGVAFG